MFAQSKLIYIVYLYSTIDTAAAEQCTTHHKKKRHKNEMINNEMHNVKASLKSIK